MGKTVSFSADTPNDYVVLDIPSALTDVNDITNGKFGAHTFAEPSADYNVLSATSAEYGDYLTTADGMSLYIYWGDDSEITQHKLVMLAVKKVGQHSMQELTQLFLLH